MALTSSPKSQPDLIETFLRSHNESMTSSSRLTQLASPLPCFPSLQPMHLHVHLNNVMPAMQVPFSSNPPTNHTHTSPSPIHTQRALPHFPTFGSIQPLPPPRGSLPPLEAPSILPPLEAPSSTSQQSSSFCTPAEGAVRNFEEASPACSEVPQYTSQSGSGDHEGVVDHDSEEGAMNEVKRLKRLVSNRASAKRSRQRKQDRLAELELVCAKLRIENAEAQRKLNEVLSQLKQAQEEAQALRERVGMMEGRERKECEDGAHATVCEGTIPRKSEEIGRPHPLVHNFEQSESAPTKRNEHRQAEVKDEPSPLLENPKILSCKSPLTQENHNTVNTPSRAHSPLALEGATVELATGTVLSGRCREVAGKVVQAGLTKARDVEDEQTVQEMNEVFSGIMEEDNLLIDL